MKSDEAACTECGWSYGTEEVDEPGEESANSREDVAADEASTETAQDGRDAAQAEAPVGRLNWSVAGPLLMLFGILFAFAIYVAVTHR